MVRLQFYLKARALDGPVSIGQDWNVTSPAILHTIGPRMSGNQIITIATEAADETAAAMDIAASGELSDAGLCVLFATTGYDLDRLGKALAKIGINNAIGATTGCAIGTHGFQKHGISGFYLPPQRFVVVDALIEDVARFGLPDARQLARSMRDQHKRLASDTSKAMFGVVIADAGAHCEERLIAALGMEFAGIPLVGGSAGDVYFNPAQDLPDAKRLLYKGSAVKNAALFCLISSQTPVHALSHNHYVAGNSKVVITDADPERRLVREINGRPALAEYAKACGFRRPPKSVADYARYPLMIRIGGQYFARGVQRLYPDGSIEFACAIESGVVAAIAQPQDMLARLEDMFADLSKTVGPPELIIGFECAARTVFMEQTGITKQISRVLQRNRVVGFAALGEQFNTVHVNNSFTALAIAATGVPAAGEPAPG